MPVAVNCWVFLVKATVNGPIGETVMLSSVDDDTMTFVEPVTPAETSVALIVAVPALSGVTSPFVFIVFPTVATSLFDDFQVT